MVGFLQNIVENLSLEIALLTMYKSYLFCEIPRRSSITLKPFLAMKEWSYGKSVHIDFQWVKSELSEYLIRFQIALLVFEIFLFEMRPFFVKIRHFSLVFRINDQLNSVEYSEKSNKLCHRTWSTFV